MSEKNKTALAILAEVFGYVALYYVAVQAISLYRFVKKMDTMHTQHQYLWTQYHADLKVRLENEAKTAERQSRPEPSDAVPAFKRTARRVAADN